MAVFIAGGGTVSSIINYLNYIQSNGSQYIDTGFMPNNNSRVVIDAQMPSINSPSFYFGTRTSNNTVNFNVLYSSPNIRSDYGESKVSSSQESPSDRLLIDKNKSTCLVGSTTIQNSSSTFQCQYNLFLCASNDGGAAKYFSDLRIYSCQIYDNGTLIRDYWPAIDPSGVVCLYDKVNKEYAYNAGTGEFIGG